MLMATEPSLQLAAVDPGDLTVPHEVTVDSHTGGCSVRLLLTMTAARAGAQPSLALEFRRGAGPSAYGMDWTLAGAPAVTRGLSDELPDDEREVYSFAGELLIRERVGPTRGAALRTAQVGGFTVAYFRPQATSSPWRCELWRSPTNPATTHWRAHDGKGRITVLGRDPSGSTRITDPDDATRVASWLPETTYDPVGNAVAYGWIVEDTREVDPTDPVERRGAGRRQPQRYLKRIRYANSVPLAPDDAPPAGLRWHLEAVFDYGDHRDPPQSQPDRAWPVRPDPFMTGRAGFEVRTRRLLRRILRFHDFDELGATGTLIGVTTLEHDLSQVGSVLRAVRVSGVNNGEWQELPPLRFTYSQPAVGDGLEVLLSEDRAGSDIGLGRPGATLTDLDGDGLPGILTRTDAAWYYRPNERGGRFGSPRLVSSRPSVRTAGSTVADLDRDGDIDVVVLRGRLAGTASYDGTAANWQPFQPFSSAARLDAIETKVQLLDATGDGQPDLLLGDSAGVTWWPGRGRAGFAPPRRSSRTPGTGAPPLVQDPDQNLFLADMTGDGLVDQVRVTDGCVEYWPHLGRGHFGPAVVMADPPDFGPGTFDPNRLLFTDVSGSGTADLLYVGDGELRWWLNAAGNGFVDGGRRAGLPYPDSTVTMSVHDVLGDGTRALLWTSALPGQAGAEQLLRLSGPVPAGMLTAVDASTGSRVDVSYRASTDDYVRDRDSGNHWRHRLPTHPHVVSRLERSDDIRGVTTTTSYEYHHGYHDPHERAFRGFGLVERWETGSSTDAGDAPAALFARTWYLTGDPEDYHALADRYRGDTAAETLPSCTLEQLADLDTDEYLDALGTVAGQVVREETYAADEAGTRAEHPFSVRENRFAVRRIQAADRDTRAAFLWFAAEHRAYDYEEQPTDPRVTQHLALEVGQRGEVLLEADIAYPRRPLQQIGIAAQAGAVATATQRMIASIDSVDRFEIAGPAAERSYDLAGLGIVAGAAPTPADDLADLIDTALTAPLLPHESFGTGSPQARLAGWERSLYWADGLTAAAPVGAFGREGLAHHTESACFGTNQIQQRFGTRIDDALLRTLGYRKADDLWWQDGPTHFYGARSEFRSLKRAERWDGAITSYGYDPYQLVLVSVQGAAGNETTARIDYRLLEPWQVVDANGAVHEAIYDALGVPVVSTSYGTVRATSGADRPYGNGPLASYTIQPDFSPQALLADPQRFLQSAARVIAYDHNPPAGSPPTVVTLTRQRFAHDPAPPRTSVAITYLDGGGEPVQERLLVEPGPALQRGTDGPIVVNAAGRPVTSPAEPRWLVAGPVVLDGRRRVHRTYAPFFSSVTRYEAPAEVTDVLAETVLTHDAVGRPTRQDEPNGTYTLAAFEPWRLTRSDANDTVGTSLYRATREPLPNTDPEKLALTGALAHAGTPALIDLDPLGREIRRVDPTGTGDRIVTTTLDPTGNPLRVIDGRGITALQHGRDLQARIVMEATADAGQRLLLPDAANRPAHEWIADNDHTVRTFDLLDRPLTVTATRAGAGTTPRLAEQLRYGDQPGEPDAKARNALGRVVGVRDSSGELTIVQYDPYGQALAVERKLCTEAGATPDWATPTAVALELPAYRSETAYDALGRVVTRVLPDDTVRETVHLMAGATASQRVIWTDTGSVQVVLSGVEVDEQNRRTRYLLGNGVAIERSYDTDTGRTTRHTATRPAAGAAAATTLMDLRYTYDPVGNVTRMVDEAQQPAAPTALLVGATASTHADFTYDAAYRLTSATGRVHQALLEHDYRPNLEAQGGFKGTRHLTLANGQAVERYTQTYSYDLADNMTQVRHAGATRSWTTDLWVSPTSNRALPLLDPSGATVSSPQNRFNAAGCITSLAHLRAIDWDERSLLRRAVVIDRSAAGDPDDAMEFGYDADGLRTRTASTRLVNGEVEVTDKVYLDGCEIKRVTRAGQLLLRRVTSHVDDGEGRVALLHRWTVDTLDRERPALSDRRAHYPLADHVGSSVLELDGAGDVIAYEQYFPYGGTAFLAGDRDREVEARDYRYAGKERDAATGLSYFGYRYYAPWIGRWMSPDPAGPADSSNLYAYCVDNPVTLRDPDGLETKLPGQGVPWRFITLSQVPEAKQEAAARSWPYFVVFEKGPASNDQSFREFSNQKELEAFVKAKEGRFIGAYDPRWEDALQRWPDEKTAAEKFMQLRPLLDALIPPPENPPEKVDPKKDPPKTEDKEKPDPNAQYGTADRKGTDKSNDPGATESKDPVTPPGQTETTTSPKPTERLPGPTTGDDKAQQGNRLGTGSGGQRPGSGAGDGSGGGATQGDGPSGDPKGASFGMADEMHISKDPKWYERALMAMGGAVWSFINIFTEAGKQLYDFGGMAAELISKEFGSGDYEHKFASGIGHIAQEKPTVGHVFSTIGKGITGTPGRWLDAIEREDYAAFGAESLNVYSLGRAGGSLAKGVGSVAFNRAVNLMGRFGGATGEAWRASIRNGQVARMAAGGNFPQGVAWRYGGINPAKPGLFGSYSSALNRITIMEKSFIPSFLDRFPSSVRALFSADNPYSLRHGLGWSRLLRGRSTMTTPVHEGWHATQWSRFPGWAQGAGAAGGLPYNLRPLEFTQPGGLAPLPGAHNYAYTYAPASPFSYSLGYSTPFLSPQPVGQKTH